MNAKEIISKLSLLEKAALLGGKNEWESRDIPRLNIQSITFADGPHGLRRQEGAGDHLGLNASLPATCFPTAATVANSWDEKLGEEIGQALGEEALAQKVDVLLGPGLNMKRSPLCGRNFEYFSEDPILAGKMAAAYVRGIQSKNIYSCPKHFAVNSREYRRMAMNAVVDERTLREIYLTAFEIAVKEPVIELEYLDEDGNTQHKNMRGSIGVMSSFNRLGGVWTGGCSELLNEVLRGEWGFTGCVITDYDGTEYMNCEWAVSNGNDLILANISTLPVLPVIEAALHVKDNDHSKKFDKGAHHKLARKAAANSAVLLKNDEDILPLKAGTKVALRGPFVDKPRYQGSGSSQVNSTKVEKVSEVIGNYNLEVVEDPREADVVLYFFGLDEIAESEGADRMSMDIPEYQVKELKKLIALNKNIVGVMSAGSAVKMPWLDNLKALLHGYLTGQAGASALLDIITGKTVPTGKLSESYPFSYTDCSIVNFSADDTRNLQYREGPFIGYRYYDTAGVAVQFPFGFGLSYTTFEYGNLEVTEDGVSFTVTNTGKRDGAEIAQLYIGKKHSGLIRPRKELKGFAKVWVKAGESKEVTISFDDKTFRYFSTVSDKWEVEGGEYRIYVGGNVRDIALEGSIVKEGTIEELPYDIKTFSRYRSGQVRNVHYDEFEKIYGRALPEEKVGPLDINDALCQMDTAKSVLCRLVYKILERKLEKSYEKGVPDLNIMFIYNMPFRAICKMSGGMVSRDMVESIVTIVNGHFFKGLGGVIIGFFRNKSANKKYEKKLRNM